jgi:hypothetical protein
MDEDDVFVLERVARIAPFQFFGEAAVQDDFSQAREFALPFLGFS